MRGSTARPHVFPVAPEFTNWRSEQQGWRATCALLDRSHHMTDLFLSGLDALRLLSDFGVNSFAGFAPGKAKQYVAAAGRVRAILTVGEEFGLVRAGAKAYSTANLESGWIPTAVPAIFGAETTGYREWLDASALGSLGGSMDAADIADYYVTPYDIGYGRTVTFDHDFLGREALMRIAGGPHRAKVTLVWNPDDVAAVVRSLCEPGTPAKYLELPKSRYAFFQADAVLHDGVLAGLSPAGGRPGDGRPRPVRPRGARVLPHGLIHFLHCQSRALASAAPRARVSSLAQAAADLIVARATRLADTAITARAPWLTALGAPLAEPGRHTAWREHVAVVAAYRDQYHVTTTDPSQPLGPHPDSDHPSHRAHQLASQAAREARHLAPLEFVSPGARPDPESPGSGREPEPTRTQRANTAGASSWQHPQHVATATHT